MEPNDIVEWHISQLIVSVAGSLLGVYWFFIRPRKFREAQLSTPIWKTWAGRIVLFLFVIGILIFELVKNWKGPPDPIN